MEALTPRIQKQPPLNSNNKRAISEVISETSPKFDHRGNIVEPFDNEAKRDLEFQEKLSTMLIELMLEFHAWSISRPSQETDRTADILEKEINALIETEKEQGMSSTFQTPSMTIIGRPVFCIAFASVIYFAYMAY
ncbi:hypothetical protein EW026_g7837 [Hermanssonia centrifuga]|uniref:Uncharacterized protein n=1 Tax=Hermanssonia centrifuga TaxID=98765 RepID=A0A4S4K6H8_9APHY|nr:hypothetical protein EW026_g7837 [Hermanssonia centrifuga]